MSKHARVSKKWVADTAERVGWTFLQGGLGLLSVETFDLPVEYAALIAAGLALVKAAVARKVGNPDSASTLPGV